MLFQEIHRTNLAEFMHRKCINHPESDVGFWRKAALKVHISKINEILMQRGEEHSKKMSQDDFANPFLPSHSSFMPQILMCSTILALQYVQ